MPFPKLGWISFRAIGALIPAISAGGFGVGWATTVNDSNPDKLVNALELLAGCAEIIESCRGRLTRRKEAYLAFHRADPCPWPPPVALDWLWVDEGSIDPAAYPEIEAPAYAAPPGGEQRAS
jgi:hypothetical protein